MRSEFSLNAAAKTAVKAFRDAKPWQGSIEERGDKFAELHRGLTNAYNLETMLLRDDSEPNAASGESRFDPVKNKILLRGRLSVVTYLFCFAAACGLSRRAALHLAHATFRHYFPRSYRGCRMVNGMLVRN
jgi:hypothetical protein